MAAPIPICSSNPPSLFNTSSRKIATHSMDVVQTFERRTRATADSKRPLMLRPVRSAARPVRMSQLEDSSWVKA